MTHRVALVSAGDAGAHAGQLTPAGRRAVAQPNRDRVLDAVPAAPA